MRVVPWLLGLAACTRVHVAPLEPPYAPPARLPGPAGQGQVVPEPLLAVDTQVREAGDALRRNDWTGADQATGDARAAWTLAEPVVQAQGANDASTQKVDAGLALLARDVGARRPIPGRADAIDVGEAVTDLVGTYLNRVPASLWRLEIELRRVQLDADVGAWPAAERDLRAASNAFGLLSPDAEMLARTAPVNRTTPHVSEETSQSLDRVDAAVREQSSYEVDEKVHVASQNVSALRAIFEGPRSAAPP